MKALNEYIRLPRIKMINNIKILRNYLKEDYINTDEPITQLENGIILTDFYEFINYNNITNIDENIYLFYLDSVFNKVYKWYYDSLLFKYENYQEGIYTFETLNHSWDSKLLVDKLNKIIQSKDVEYVNPKLKTTQFEIFYNDSNIINELINNENFWSLIHLYNYYIKVIRENSIVLEPYKPQEVTDKIYNELHGIIYHITTKQKYINGIKNKELAPKWKGEWDKLANKPYNIWRDGRIFFIGNNDENEVQKQLKSIKNTSKIMNNEECIILKIDLNNYYKLKFRIDSSAFGYDAYFTEEPIPDFCIECLDLDTWKKINKEDL